MAVGIGAGGQLGLAFESVAGTYLAPTKFAPINSESLKFEQATVWRRPIRKTAAVVGAVSGNAHVNGDVEMEALEDVILYFLLAARTSTVKTGSSPNFTYTITPTSAAVPSKTLSLTIERNGLSFGYTGIVVSSFKFGLSDGLLTFSASLLGRDEASQSNVSATWPTTVPFGAGQYDIQVPTSSSVLDTDTFEYSVDDSGDPQFRLKNTGRGAQFIKYGEQTAKMTLERDFESRTDYDAYKALTSQSITILASKGANNSISILSPTAIKESYEVNLGGQGDLIRGKIAYQNVIDSSGKAYQLVVKTQEDVTP